MPCPGHSCCPLCGPEMPGDPESQSNHATAATTPASKDEQVRQLFAKALHYHDAMKTLTEMRLAVLRQINAIRSPFNSLPDELLTYIFDFVCPPIDFSKRVHSESDDEDDFFDGFSDTGSEMYPKPRNKHDMSHRYMPLILSAVCSRWRDVALSSPELWSTFGIEVVGWKMTTYVPLLRFYLQNTGPLLFSLDLDIRLQQCVYIERHDTHAPVHEWRELEPLSNLVFKEFPKKIRTLRVSGAPPAWMCFLSRQRLPNLQDLTFAWGDDMGDPTTLTIKDDAFQLFPDDPLQRSGIGAGLFPTPGLPPLTTLHLRNVHIDICVQILLSCPSLIEYHCYTPPGLPTSSTSAASVSRRVVNIKEPFTLPNLKRFGWVLPDGDEWNIALLEYIRLPCLEEFQWCGFPEEMMSLEDADVVAQFISSLPKTTLKSLIYYEFNYAFSRDTEEYLTNSRLLSHFSNVTTLAFHKCSGTFMKPLFSLLSNPTPDILRTESMTATEFPLPRLEKIVVKRIEDDGEDVGMALVEMLGRRKQSPRISHFTFEILDDEMMWSQDAQDGLRELAYEFSLTVLEKSQERVYAYFTERELALFT